MPILGQVATEAAATPELLFTATQPTVISSIYVSKSGSGSATWSLYAVPADQELADRHNLFKDIPFGGSEETIEVRGGLDLGEGDAIWVESASLGAVFNAFGATI